MKLDSSDLLEFIKICLIGIIGYILIKAILGIDIQDKDVCSCINQTIKYLPTIYLN